MKNSSRFDEKIEQKRVRSSSGSVGSAASSRTRALKSSHESSRFRRGTGSAGRASRGRAASSPETALEWVTERLPTGEPTGRAHRLDRLCITAALSLLLIRHASAGHRRDWEGDDRRRPLDAHGRAQAEALAAFATRVELGRIVSSPYDRCVQSVEPLARALRVEVESLEELSEEQQETEGAALVRALAGERAAACCHGGLSELLVGEKLKKGAALLLAERDGRLVVEERFPAP
jgi:phosphohistidine phosphatase SixA